MRGVLGASTLACLLGCQPPPEVVGPPRSAVLIVVDTLRVDHLSVYGAQRKTSPAIDALAARGTRFTRAYATAPWTMPSVSSMLTGLYPGQHGLRSIPQKLDRSLTTLPEVLRDRGFATAAVISHQLLRRKYQFAQGFETFDESAAKGKAPENISTPQVTEAATALLKDFARDDRPFFLFLHYFDPHYNYQPHDSCDFASSSAGRLEGGEDIDRLRKMKLGVDELRFVRDLYDEEICFTDRGVGQVLEALDDLDLADETLVILTADHGEELLERGWLGHTRTLYEELVHVPLIVHSPDRDPKIVETPVSLTALPSTVLLLLGLEGDLPGATLPLDGGEAPPPLIEVDFDPILASGKEKLAHKKALILGDQKLILDETTGVYERYDLAADPLERSPLPDDPALIAALASVIAATREQFDAESADLSAEEIERLRALGYIH